MLFEKQSKSPYNCTCFIGKKGGKMSILSNHLIDETGFITPKIVADEFHTTVKEIGIISGLSADTISRKDRFQSKNAQQRLRDVVLIINRALPWCGTPMQAYAWYRSEPLPSFGDLTAEDLVKRGMSSAVLEYLARIAEGGYA